MINAGSFRHLLKDYKQRRTGTRKYPNFNQNISICLVLRSQSKVQENIIESTWSFCNVSTCSSAPSCRVTQKYLTTPTKIIVLALFHGDLLGILESPTSNSDDDNLIPQRNAQNRQKNA